MVLNRPFFCPTRIHSKGSFDETVANIVGDRRWAVVTSEGWVKRSVPRVLCQTVGVPEIVIEAVRPNPKVHEIKNLGRALPEVDVVVALGGGSVIDAAKAMVTLQSLDGNMEQLLEHLVGGSDLPETFDPVSIIAVPTTSGTGSEVTRWATIWGDEKVKYSLQHPRLYPTDTVLDPSLCLSMPPSVTLSSGLDSLSHAMEAVWNHNRTPFSDQLAESAIRLLRNSLDAVMESPNNLELRRTMQFASLIAGFAMGTTQTALAHSISYPFTAHFGIPHGFACGFTLPEVAAYNLATNADRLQPIANGLGCEPSVIPDHLAQWLESLGVGQHIAQFVTPDVTDELGDDLITRARAANNLRDVDGPTARRLVRSSLERFARSVLDSNFTKDLSKH